MAVLVQPNDMEFSGERSESAATTGYAAAGGAMLGVANGPRQRKMTMSAMAINEKNNLLSRRR